MKKQVELKEYIKSLGITYGEVGRQTGFSPQHIESVANGRIPAGYLFRKKLLDWGRGKIDILKLALIEKKGK